MGHVFRFPRTLTRWRPPRRLRPSHLLFALLVALALAARFIPSNAPTSPRASATAIDGDTLRMGQQLIRLQGIDAPEFEQHCQDEQGRAWLCGREAHAGLAQLIGHSLISCTINGSEPLRPRSSDLLHRSGWRCRRSHGARRPGRQFPRLAVPAGTAAGPGSEARCLARHFRDTARLAPQAQNRGPLKRCRTSPPGSSRPSAARTA